MAQPRVARRRPPRRTLPSPGAVTRTRRPPVSLQPLRVGVLGAGTVGREVVRAFLDGSPRLAPADGSPLVLAGVAVRDVARASAAGIPRRLSHRRAGAPRRGSGRRRAGRGHGRRGAGPDARAWRPSPTAAPSSRPTSTSSPHHGPELEQVARQAGSPLRFEAAVAGGIPVLGPLAQDLGANRVARVRGIVNGTTNFILTAMAREGRGYDEVLAEAQRLGYAEADPAADVEGLDAVNKLVLLVRLAFGAWIDPAAVSNRPGTARGGDGAPGITGVTADDVAALAGEGRILRLIATGAARGGRGTRGLGRADGRAGRLAVRAVRRRAQPGRGRRDAGRPGRVRGPGRRRVRDRVGGARRPRRDRARARLDLGGQRAGRRAIVARASAPWPQNASRRRPAPATRPRTDRPCHRPASPARASSTATATSCPSTPARPSCRSARARRRSSARAGSASRSACASCT